MEMQVCLTCIKGIKFWTGSWSMGIMTFTACKFES
jgi:hypothetical protein